MDIIDRILSAFLTFMGILFSLIIALALSETFAHLYVTLLGSRGAVFWTMLLAAIGGAIAKWRHLAKTPQSHSATARFVPPPEPEEDDPNPNEIDMANAEDVAKVQSCRDPALWHQAAMAALAYRGDPHDFLPWVLQQPETDRATAGWMFLWAEGSLYLNGGTDFPLDNLATEQMMDLFRSICARSHTTGFMNDILGLDPGFEAERLKCLAIIENAATAPGIVAPVTLLARPFDRPRPDGRFTLDDGLILCAQPL